MPEHFLNITGTDYLVLDDYQEIDGLGEIDGTPDVIELLYTEEDVDQYVTYPEENQNGYGVIVSYDSWNGVLPGPTNTIKMIAPTGVKEGYSIDAGGIVKI